MEEKLIGAYAPNCNNLLLRNLEYAAAKMHEDSASCDTSGTRMYMTLGVITYGILLMNEVASEVAHDTIGSIQTEKGLYKTEVKKQCNIVSKLLRKYNSTIGMAVENDDAMFDCIDEAKDKYREYIDKELTIFYYALKQEMDSNEVDNSTLRANIELAETLLEMSVKQQDAMKKQFFSIRGRVQHLDFISLKDIQVQFAKLRKMINNDRCEKNANLNSERCVKAFHSLFKKMTDDHKIVEIMQCD